MTDVTINQPHEFWRWVQYGEVIPEAKDHFLPPGDIKMRIGVDNMEISTRAVNLIQKAGFVDVHQVAEFGYRWNWVSNCGKKTVNELKNECKRFGVVWTQGPGEQVPTTPHICTTACTSSYNRGWNDGYEYAKSKQRVSREEQR